MSDSKSSVTRKRFTSEQKFKIVKEHMTAKTPISELCKKYGMSAKSFYDWQEIFFSSAQQGFDKKRGPQSGSAREDQKVLDLESEIHRMREVISEITAENIAFKKKSSGFFR